MNLEDVSLAEEAIVNAVVAVQQREPYSCQVLRSKVGSAKSPPLVEEIHYASGLSRRSVAYPDRATPLPQVPSSHDASPYRTRTCGLRSADLRMSQVRTRPKGADRRPIKSEKAGWLNSCDIRRGVTENAIYELRREKIVQVWSVIDKAAIEAQL